jgi:hypothetical protein
MNPKIVEYAAKALQAFAAIIVVVKGPKVWENISKHLRK